MNYKLYDILLGYCMTEKASLALDAAMKYTFKVCKSASKSSVKQAVEKIFDVKVLSVNIVNIPGKERVFRGRRGFRAGFKKAIIKVNKNIAIDALGSNS